MHKVDLPGKLKQLTLFPSVVEIASFLNKEKISEAKTYILKKNDPHLIISAISLCNMYVNKPFYQWLKSELFKNELSDKIKNNIIVSDFYLDAISVGETTSESLLVSLNDSADIISRLPADCASKVFGSVSMGLYLRGEHTLAKELMIKALENNPKQLEIEKRALGYIKDEKLKALWAHGLYQWINSDFKSNPRNIKVK